MTRAVLVLGMHRSGTSAVAGLVGLLGVPLSRAEDLVGATPSNPRGYWESASLKAVNTRLLGELGGRWDGPPALAPGWERARSLEDLRAAAREAAAMSFQTPVWTWKDPRNCLTLPFWVDALELEPTLVVVHRHPLGVAESLAVRDGTLLQSGIALWERYNRSLLAVAAGRPALVVGYDELVEAPASVIAEIAGFLACRGFGVRSPAGGLDGFVDPALRHTRFELGAAPPGCLSHSQRRLALALTRLRGAHEWLPFPDLPPETPTTEALLAERRASSALRTQVRQLEERAADLEERVGEVTRELEAIQASEAWRVTAPVRVLARLLRWRGTARQLAAAADRQLDEELA